MYLRLAIEEHLCTQERERDRMVSWATQGSRLSSFPFLLVLVVSVANVIRPDLQDLGSDRLQAGLVT